MKRACHALGLPRATAYRRRGAKPRPARPARKSPPRSLSSAERAQVLAVLDSDRFLDQPPREVYAKLLGEGTHLCSVRTMYHLLQARGPLRTHLVQPWSGLACPKDSSETSYLPLGGARDESVAFCVACRPLLGLRVIPDGAVRPTTWLPPWKRG